ncbi:MAG: ATPase [Clostridiaceae bacterium BRH_c20a]|nr:MAG: ATPase [Clostridiaceae bacterium BRH_c20a]
MELSLVDLRRAFESEDYICDDEVIMNVYLAIKLQKPLLVTGAPGVGKTEIAKVLSRIFQTDLIRLQCYEGLDENKALYEWNYQKQLLHIQINKEREQLSELETGIFSKDYLLERPLLKAILTEKRSVLLIDEIDKTDEEFEAFLFEVLSDFQVSIPELGTIAAKQIPIVILTSNGERDLSDGLKRRCLFLYIGYPTLEKELQIIRAKVPGIAERLAGDIASAVYIIRQKLNLRKKPAISETLDWARALEALMAVNLDQDLIDKTLNVVLKDKQDLDTFRELLGSHGLQREIAKLGG